MNQADREDIIKSLAMSMGMDDTTGSKYSNAHYDAATGTFYCEGITLPHSSLERICDWYKVQMERYRQLASRDKGVLEQYMRYAVAYNAILMLKDNMEK